MKALSKIARVEEVPFGERMNIHRWTLANGLRVLTLVDRSAPVVSYQTWFRVGSRHEKKGKTGLAHLFEHLMFNETKNLPAGEFDKKLEAAGGETNAGTWVDWTYYYENLPRSELPLVIKLESDRMANLILRDKQVTSEKDVVANERRYRVDDDVEGAANELLYATAFRKHPYHWPTIGWMRDIQNFTTKDCRAFYKTFYAPNNAMIVLAGDFDEEAAIATIWKHYGRIRAQKLPREAKTKEPPQTAERSTTLRFATPTEKVTLGYKGPPFDHYDHAVLTIANEILFGGRSSRVYRRLVTDEERASEARGSVSPFRDSGLIEIWLGMRPGHKAKQGVRILEQEIACMASKLVTPEELEKAKNRMELSFIEALETASGKAEQIGFYETVLGDASRVFARVDDYRRVSAHDIREAVKKYFVKRHRTVVWVQPSGAAPDVQEEQEAAE